MPHQALKPMRYAGVNYEAGDPIPAMTERDAKVLIALRKVQLVAEAQAAPKAEPAPAAKSKRYSRRDMRAEP